MRGHIADTHTLGGVDMPFVVMTFVLRLSAITIIEQQQKLTVPY